MGDTKTIKMTKDKDCKHSVRYASDDKDVPIATVYLSRKFSHTMPDAIIVTVTAIE